METQSPRECNPDHQIKASADQKLALIRGILKSWAGVWPIAAAWHETIDLLSKLYEAVNPQSMLDLDVNRLADREEQDPGDMSQLVAGIQILNTCRPVAYVIPFDSLS